MEMQKPAFTEAEINMFKSQPWITRKSKFLESKQLKISKKKKEK